VSAKSCRRLLAVLLISLAGAFLPAFHDKIKELMDAMNTTRIVSIIPADAQTAEDVLAKYARWRKRQKGHKKKKKRR
jgi:hypothetical protein